MSQVAVWFDAAADWLAARPARPSAGQASGFRHLPVPWWAGEQAPEEVVSAIADTDRPPGFTMYVKHQALLGVESSWQRAAEEAFLRLQVEWAAALRAARAS